jgi:hypothetical protein
MMLEMFDCSCCVMESSCALQTLIFILGCLQSVAKDSLEINGGRASRVFVLLCLDTTLSGGGLEVTRHILHSHTWEAAHPAGSDLHTGLRLFGTE